MEILSNFGFEPILFLAQIINFLIIFFLLKKFLYAPIQKVLEERKKKIDDGLKNAEESARLIQETISKEEEILKKAQDEAKKLIAEAHAKHDTILKKTEDESSSKVDQMLKEARNQISFETAQAEKRLSVQMSKIAIHFLQESLKGFFGPQEQEAIIKNAIKKLKEKVD